MMVLWRYLVLQATPYQTCMQNIKKKFKGLQTNKSQRTMTRKVEVKSIVDNITELSLQTEPLCKGAAILYSVERLSLLRKCLDECSLLGGYRISKGPCIRVPL